MEKFTTLITTAVPLRVENIDTDQIIPARFLKATDREGFGEKLFSDWRYQADGSVNKDFVLNDERFKGKILLAGRNFGCGSSREHAAWALYGHGFRVVVSSSFADIFKTNALNNGLLPVCVSETFLNKLFRWVQAFPSAKLKVSLEEQYIEITDLQVKDFFQIPAFKRECLLKGQDDIALLLDMEQEIVDYEKTSAHLRLLN